MSAEPSPRIAAILQRSFLWTIALILAAAVQSARVQAQVDPATWCAHVTCLSPADAAQIAKATAEDGITTDQELLIIDTTAAISGNATLAAMAEVMDKAIGFAKMLGLWNPTDPTQEALKLVSDELNYLQSEIQNIQSVLISLNDKILYQNNKTNLQFLTGYYNQVSTALGFIRTRPADQGSVEVEIGAIAGYARNFLVPAANGSPPTPSSIWQWSRLEVVTGPGAPAARYFDTDFETDPALRYYFSTLIALVVAIEWDEALAESIHPGGRDAVRQRFMSELLMHTAFLRIRQGRRAGDLPTLAESLRAKVMCTVGPAASLPVNGRCPLLGSCSVPGASTGLFAAGDFLSQTANFACSSQPYPEANSAANAEGDALANELGLTAMGLMADMLEGMAYTGFPKPLHDSGCSPSFQQSAPIVHALYGVKPDGELLWYDDVIPTAMFSSGDPCTQTAPAASQLVRTRLIPIATLLGTSGSANSGGTGPFNASGPAQGSVPAAGGAAQPRLAPRAHPLPAAAFAGSTTMRGQIQQQSPIPKTASRQFNGPQLVANGFQAFTQIIPAGGYGLYGVTAAGLLRWYSHVGASDGARQWTGPVDISTGWNNFVRIVPGGNGVLYGIGRDGSLRWYRQLSNSDGTPQPRMSGPNIVGNGWGNFIDVFSTGEGVLYGVTRDGRLLWYRHRAYLTGDAVCTAGAGSAAPGGPRANPLARPRVSCWEGPVVVGTGWQNFSHIFAADHGMIYAVQRDGSLLSYVHSGYLDGTVRWSGPTRIGSGWNAFNRTFALIALAPDPSLPPPRIN